jgi:hypothetical protein
VEVGWIEVMIGFLHKPREAIDHSASVNRYSAPSYPQTTAWQQQEVEDINIKKRLTTQHHEFVSTWHKLFQIQVTMI